MPAQLLNQGFAQLAGRFVLPLYYPTVAVMTSASTNAFVLRNPDAQVVIVPLELSADVGVRDCDAYASKRELFQRRVAP